MFLTSREQLGDSNKALDIVFYVAVAVLFTLLCTVVILHCILRRQQRQCVQSTPYSIVILHTIRVNSSESESYIQEKINLNHDNTVASIQVSKHTSFPKESGCQCPFRPHLSPSSLEKASDNDISNRPTTDIARPVPSYTPARQSIKLMDA